MAKTVSSKEIIEKLKSVLSGDLSAEGFTFSGDLDANKNKIKSGDECVNLIGSNLVIYSSESEEEQQDRAEIKRLLERILQRQEIGELRAEKAREKVLCALQVLEDGIRTMQSDLFSALDRIAQERYKNARENLFSLLNEMWQGKRDPNYAKHVREWSYKVLEYAPDDFYACFCLKIFVENRNIRDVQEFLSKGAETHTQDEILFVLRTTLLFYEAGYPVEKWIASLSEAGLKAHFEKKYAEEKKNVLGDLYDPAVDRDVFVAYSHKDIENAREVVRYLEENEKLECFFAVRNLRQCDGGAFDDALKTAIKHCKVFLFISSERSRQKDCYAQTEMRFIRDFDRARYEDKDKNFVVGCDYERINRQYKMPRVEYLVGEHYEGTTRPEKETKKFFAGLSYCKELDVLGERVYGIIEEGKWCPVEPAPKKTEEKVAPVTPPKTPKKYCVGCLTACDLEVKFCPECGKRTFASTEEEAKAKNSSKYCTTCLTPNPVSAKFCKECGKTEFVSTYAEAEEIKALAEQIAEEEKRAAEEAERQRKEEEARKRREEEERKRREEAERMQREEAERLREEERRRQAAKAEEEARKRKEEEERKQREEAERKQREEEERKQKEAERQKEEEARRQAAKYAEAATRTAMDAQTAEDYFFGYNGKPKDYKKAAEYARKAAEAGHAGAQFLLGYCYDAGLGVTQSYSKAVEWYTKGATKGNPDARYNLGVCYEKGQGVTQSYEKAAEWYAKAAAQGHAWAQYNLALCYEYGKGVALSIEKAIEWYTKAAEKGDSDAQNALNRLKDQKTKGVSVAKENGSWLLTGDNYYWGLEGKSRDVAKAAKCYSEGAEEGDREAQYSLACCYRYGNGVPLSDEKAATWFLMAAERGDWHAQQELASCYQLGKGVEKSSWKAKKWFAEAMEARAESAKTEFKVNFTMGIKAAQSYFKMYPNDSGMQFLMGLCYEFGMGYKQSYADAFECYRKAATAARSDFRAQYALGYCYEMGNGVAKSKDLAIAWYKKAAAQEHFDALRRLKALGVYSF